MLDPVVGNDDLLWGNMAWRAILQSRQLKSKLTIFSASHISNMETWYNFPEATTVRYLYVVRTTSFISHIPFHFESLVRILDLNPITINPILTSMYSLFISHHCRTSCPQDFPLVP
jgi:hypothetical protein